MDSEKLKYWEADGNSSLTISNNCAKHGEDSLRWSWEGSTNASIIYTNPDLFHALNIKANKCLAFWLNSRQQSYEPLFVEFRTSDEQIIDKIWFHVNFIGWRPLGIRYNLIDSLKQQSHQIHSVKFISPSSLENGIYYINAPNFEFNHSGPKADYQQPWQNDVKKLADPSLSLYSETNITYNRPWLTNTKYPDEVTEDDIASIKKLKDRWLKPPPYNSWSAGTKPEPLEKLQGLCAKYNIRRNEENFITGIPLGKGGFYSPTNALDLQPFLVGPFKKAAISFCSYKDKSSAEAQATWNLFIDLSDYLLEQGWSEGNGNMEGNLDIGYEIRNFPSCLFYVRDSLQEAGRLHSVICAALWIMYGHLLLEEKPSVMDTDIIHNYLLNCLTLILCIPDTHEIHQRLHSFTYLIEYVLEKLIHDPVALDGLVHHHWMSHFDYASYSLPDIIKIGSVFNDTEFHFSDNVRRIIRRSAYAVNFCLVDAEKIPPNVAARAGKPTVCNGLNMIKTCVSVCDDNHTYDPFLAGVLIGLCSKTDKTIAPYIRDGIDVIELDGHLTLNSTAGAIHRRAKQFYVSIVGMGKNRRGLEIYGWLSDTNNYGIYARNCSIFIVPADNEGKIKYENARCDVAGWNPSHWPGTTSLLRPRIELFESYCNLTAKNWFAGGTSIDGRDGMWSCDFNVWDIKFKRSVYCFDNRITVLTSDIDFVSNSSSAYPRITTLFQSSYSNINTPLYLNSSDVIQTFPFEETYELNENKVHTITDNCQISYYLHPNLNQQPMKLKLKCSEQEMIYINQFYLIDPKQNPILDMKQKKFKEPKLVDNEKYFKLTKENYALGYVEHMERNEMFIYTILLNSTNEQVKQWTEQFETTTTNDNPWANDEQILPPLIVLKQDINTHIFYDRDTDTTCYTLFNVDKANSSAILDKGFILSISQPCTVIIRGRIPTLSCSIATTDFNRKEPLEFILRGQWTNVKLLSDDENHTVTIELDTSMPDTKVIVHQRMYMPVLFHVDIDENN